MKVTKTQLKQIIKEEVSKFQKTAILENRKKEIIKEIRLLSEDDSREGFEWVDQNLSSIPYFDNFQGLSNISSIENDISAYYKDVVNNEDERDYGWFLGDNVASYFKNSYNHLAENVSDPAMRELFLNPSNENGDAVKAVNWVKSLPSTQDGSYLGNSNSFGKISITFSKLFEELLDSSNENSYSPQQVPLLVPYVIYLFKNVVWEKLFSLHQTMPA
jgi:hypothetical protein